MGTEEKGGSLILTKVAISGSEGIERVSVFLWRNPACFTLHFSSRPPRPPGSLSHTLVQDELSRSRGSPLLPRPFAPGSISLTSSSRPPRPSPFFRFSSSSPPAPRRHPLSIYFSLFGAVDRVTSNVNQSVGIVASFLRPAVLIPALTALAERIFRCYSYASISRRIHCCASQVRPASSSSRTQRSFSVSLDFGEPPVNVQQVL